VAGLPLSAAEGYVLSRMDGVMTVGELCSACNLTEDEGERILQKLLELGVIDVLSAVEVDGAGPQAAWASKVGKKVDPRAQGEGKDVSRELKARVNEMEVRAERANFYELLGVVPNAERNEIRKAYFDLSREFHPDAYFGKDLGRWRPKMEAIFAKITHAYETLSRNRDRVRYDEYIADQIRAWEVEQRLAKIPALMLYRPKDRERVPEEASGEPLEQLEPPSGAAAPAWTPAPETPPPAPAPTPKPVPTLGPETDLHRRLRRERAKKAVAALLKSSAPAQAEQAEATFKPKTAKEKLALQYAVAGADALDRKEFVTALGNFELALELTPEDPELLKAVERARREARVALSSTYERQGAFEEDLRQYVKAAQSFMKALDVQTENHQLMERAARNLLLGGGNLRKARELASKAVEADRTNVDYRITLGEILLKAGLAADAGREFDEVRRVDPGNERLARLVGRGG